MAYVLVRARLAILQPVFALQAKVYCRQCLAVLLSIWVLHAVADIAHLRAGVDAGTLKA